MSTTTKIIVIVLILVSFIFGSLLYFGKFYTLSPSYTDYFLFAISISFPSIVMIGLILRYRKILVWIYNVFYLRAINDLNATIDGVLPVSKDGASFFLLSLMTTTFTVFLFDSYPIKTILEVLPFSTVSQQISLPCQTAIETIFQNNVLGIMALVVAGPIWIIFLRQFRNIRRSATGKIRGSQSLLFYFYFILTLFVLGHFVDIGCETNKPFVIHSFSFTAEKILGFSIITSMIFGGPIWFVIFIIDRTLIRKIVLDSTISNKS